MKKVFFLLLMLFLVFGISVNSPLLMADEDDNDSDRDNSGSSGDSDDDENKEDKDETKIDDDEADDEDSKNRIRSRSRERSGENEFREEIEIEFEDGKRKVRIKRRFIDEDGNEVRIDIRIEEIIKDGKLIRKIKSKRKISGEYFEVETELELKDDFEGNRSRIRAKLSNGNFSLIDILPEEAHEIALERLRSRNLSMELIEIKHKNVPRVVYNIQTNKNGRFLGIFKLKIKMEAQIDSETGELLGTSKPWWAFLVSGEESDQTGDGEEDETEENETEQNETACPELIPPSPDWCADGEIIEGQILENGCMGPPTCNLGINETEGNETVQNLTA